MLVLSRRFLPLFVVQALNALNDNLFKNALVVLVVFRTAEVGAVLVALSGGIFLLPYVLVSATAGQLADKIDKARLIWLSQLAAVALMAAAAGALLAGSVPALLAVLFGLGAHAAFFGPLKYGILPELLAPADLLRGNALVEAGTFAAILLGTIAGGVLIGRGEGAAIVAGAGLIVALAGLAAAAAIPALPAADPSVRLRANVAAETLGLIRTARTNRVVWISVLGLSWFWALGATFLAQFPVLAQAEFHADNRVVTLLLTAFALGVGLGSLAAGRLAPRAGTVPVARCVAQSIHLGLRRPQHTRRRRALDHAVRHAERAVGVWPPSSARSARRRAAACIPSRSTPCCSKPPTRSPAPAWLPPATSSTPSSSSSARS